MKKIIKIILTTIFIIGIIFVIYKLIANYSDDVLFIMIIASVFFLCHLFAWIFPKHCFNLCWKITRFMPDNYDYDTSYSKLELIDIGLIITANIILLISILLIFF